jgi:hypothetical protein
MFVFVFVPLLQPYSLKASPLVHATTKIKKGKQIKDIKRSDNESDFKK